MDSRWRYDPVGGCLSLRHRGRIALVALFDSSPGKKFDESIPVVFENLQMAERGAHLPGSQQMILKWH